MLSTEDHRRGHAVSVPILALTLVAMVTTMTMSLSDHAGQAAAYDLAVSRAERAAAQIVQTCAAGDCTKPPEAEICVDSRGVVVAVSVDWTPRLWQGLTPVTATRVLVYDPGFGLDTWASELRDDTDNCT